MLTEHSIIDKIEILPETKHIQVRRVSVIVRDGLEVARTYHRHTLLFGDDLTNEDPSVAAVARAVWTL